MTFPVSRPVSIGRFLTLAFTVCFAAAASSAWADDESPKGTKKAGENGKDERKPHVANPFPKRIHAPNLEGGVEWLNTSGEITLKDLRGKIVLLDFWTYCCINCMHVLPDLAYLEEKFPNELVVIGVHSAKFDNEKETGNIRKAILRYEIAHPVINDARMTVWRKFQVNSWPTLALIDPEGYLCGMASGEGNREAVEQAIERLIEYHKHKGTLDETPVQFALERNKQPDTPLKFPGKVLADVPGQRLFISDSNHNRIIISSLDGQLVDVIGSGQIGKEDGTFEQAQFDHPQGMCLVGETLYVADTENHLIRTVDLGAKTVSTLAGTGEQGHFGGGGGKLKQTAINSPWDLYSLDNVLYIAMAGPHQLWSHQLGSGTIQPYAGSGRENIVDGTLAESALAQPSGLASDGSYLFVADSEGSSIRRISAIGRGNLLEPEGLVETVVGTFDLPQGQSLFAFGDVDGIGPEARLQHPLGVVYHEHGLFVADTYNHKIKRVNLNTRVCETWLGNGKSGANLSPLQLSEPSGLTISGDSLFVADTNNHRVLKISLITKQAQEFVIRGLTPPAGSAEEESSPATTESEDGPQTLKQQQVVAGEAVRIEVGFKLPEGYKLNEDVPLKYSLETVEGQPVVAADQFKRRKTAELQDSKAVVSLPLAVKSGQSVLKLTLTYGYCREGKGGLCKLGTSTWKIPLEVVADGKADKLTLTATPKS
ncbi:MAG: thioredoxin-like domain-containing protein [Planctomycetaceae bacterium]